MAIAQTKPADKIVRFIYLVSKARKLNTEYQKSMEVAAKNIQGWYKKQMNDATFQLLSIKRAGADIILTYFAKEFGQLY